MDKIDSGQSDRFFDAWRVGVWPMCFVMFFGCANQNNDVKQFNFFHLVDVVVVVMRKENLENQTLFKKEHSIKFFFPSKVF